MTRNRYVSMMLREFIRLILAESQHDDLKEAQRAWNSLMRFLSVPRNVETAAAASPLATKNAGIFSLWIPGDEIHHDLAGYHLHVSAWEALILKDRFMDLDPSGERVHKEKELQVPITVPKNVESDWVDQKDPAGVARVVSAWAANASEPMNRLFLHEFLHVLHAERAGPEAIQKAFKGPQHPTTKKRMNARELKRQKIPKMSAWGHPSVADIVSSDRGTESYATMDNALHYAKELLDANPHISLPKFMKDAMMSVGGPNDTVPTSAQRRRARMLSKLWYDHNAEMKR